MKVPRLTRPLTLETPRRTPDGAGGFNEDWTPLGTLYGEVTASSAREARGLSGSLSLLGLKITVRGMPQGFVSRPVPGQRFRDKARLFNIHAVTEAHADGRYLYCFVEEEMAA